MGITKALGAGHLGLFFVVVFCVVLLHADETIGLSRPGDGMKEPASGYVDRDRVVLYFLLKFVKLFSRVSCQTEQNFVLDVLSLLLW